MTALVYFYRNTGKSKRNKFMDSIPAKQHPISIRANVSINRLNKISDYLYHILLVTPPKKHSFIILHILYAPFENSINKLNLPDVSESVPFEAAGRSIRVGVSISIKDIGFESLYEQMCDAKSQKELNAIVSRTLFDALLEIYESKIKQNQDNGVQRAKDTIDSANEIEPSSEDLIKKIACEAIGKSKSKASKPKFSNFSDQ